MPVLIEQFKDFYAELNLASLHELDTLYDDTVVFIDPVGELNGLPALLAYFQTLCARLNYCRFRYESELVDGERAVIHWVMEYSHPRLARGEPLALHGATHLEFGQKIIYHRDYYDLGAMCYEHLPLLGSVTRRVRQRLAH